MNGRDDAMLSRRLVELIGMWTSRLGIGSNRRYGFGLVEELCDELVLRLKDRLLNADVEAAPVVWECDYVLVESIERPKLLSQISQDDVLRLIPRRQVFVPVTLNWWILVCLGRRQGILCPGQESRR